MLVYVLMEDDEGGSLGKTDWQPKRVVTSLEEAERWSDSDKDLRGYAIFELEE